MFLSLLIFIDITNIHQSFKSSKKLYQKNVIKYDLNFFIIPIVIKLFLWQWWMTVFTKI